MPKIKIQHIDYAWALEEYFPINFIVVGTQAWFDTCFTADALARIDKKVIRDPQDPIELNEIITWMMAQKALGNDSETTGADRRSGLDPWRPGSRMLTLQMGTRDKVYIIQPELIPYFKGVLESREILHLFQNALYDWKYLFAKYGIHPNRLYDTMIAEQILTAGLYGFDVGLADLARRYPPHRIISKAQRAQFVTFEEQGGKFTWEMLYYAARDVVLLFPIMDGQLPEIKKFQLEKVANLEFRLIQVMAMMELGGVYINKEKHQLAIAYWKKRLAQKEKEVLAEYDRQVKTTRELEQRLFGGETYSFKITSPTKKLEALRELGMDLEDTQTDSLEAIDNQLAKLLIEYSEAYKIVTTYGEKMIERVNPQTNRLHPRWNQLGAGDSNEAGGKATKNTIATGRVAGDFMQLPKDHTVYETVTDSKELAQVRLQFHERLQSLTSPPQLQPTS